MESRILALALIFFFSTSAWGQTNGPIIGLFPLENLSAQAGHEGWSKWLANMLQADLMSATPQRFEVYLNKVRSQLTNSGWNGQTPVSRALADKVARELRLSKIVLGSFKRDESGWKLSLNLIEVSGGKQERNFEIAQVSTLRLRASMAEDFSEALGLKPETEWLRVWLNSNISNEDVDRFFALNEALESGHDSQEILKDIRIAVAKAPDFMMGQEMLVKALLITDNKAEAFVEAKKLIAMAPRLCEGYVSAAYCLDGKEPEFDQLLLEALKVHPGCPTAARPLFLKWLDEERWPELKSSAGAAHEALPQERFATAVLALALTRLQEPDAAYELLEKLGSLDDEPNAEVHGLVLLAAAGINLKALGREALWLKRQCPTNREAQKIPSDADETFWIRNATSFTNTLPHLDSVEELNVRLSKLLSAEERGLALNPLAVTPAISNTAQVLTVGLTNPVLKAAILFASVVEERVRNEQTTNSLWAGKLPVCHYYASRLAALLRSVGIPAWLVHVDLAGELASGYHDRTAVKLRDEVMQFDPTAATIVGWRDHTRILDDVQAIAHHLLQSQDLPQIRVAQKLDNDLWARTAVIINLAGLQRIEEAEQLWKALGPEATTRWDYYYSRAAIEERRKRPLEAIAWLEQAARLSTNNAQIEEVMGQVYSELGQSDAAAEHLAKALKLGAAQSEPSRKEELQMALKFSQGMREAGGMSREELLVQATNGHLQAQLILANQMFDKRETDEGLKWLLAAAKQGDPLAQAEAGRNLLLVRGPSAGPEALELLRKAAEQGFVKAYYPLALLLYEGKGVPKNEVQATMWAQLGSVVGDSNCRSLLKELQLFADSTSFVEGSKQAQERLARKPK